MQEVNNVANKGKSGSQFSAGDNQTAENGDKDLQTLIAEMPDNSKYRPKYSWERLRKLIIENPKLTCPQLAKVLGISHNAVWLLLKSHKDELLEYPAFKENIPESLYYDLYRYRKHITDAKLKKESPYRLQGMMYYTHNMLRLEEGKSTANLDVIGEFKKSEDRLRGALQVIEGTDVMLDNNGVVAEVVVTSNLDSVYPKKEVSQVLKVIEETPQDVGDKVVDVDPSCIEVCK